MVGPARSQKGVDEPSEPKSVTYKELDIEYVLFRLRCYCTATRPLTLPSYPEWLVNIAVENAKKAGLPLNWLDQKLKDLENSEHANLYHSM